MIDITKEALNQRLDEIELEQLRDRISELKIERDRVANTLDDLIDQKEK